MKFKRIICGIIFIVLFGFFTYATQTIDVKAIGDYHITVGFSFINNIFNLLLPYNKFFFAISNYLGYSAFIVCGIYGSIGIIQLIKRKKISLVDKEIILLGVLYVVILIFKLVFDKVTINYRPYMIDGIFEPSYPSSHTVMAVVIFGSSIIINAKKYNNKFTHLTNYICVVLLFAVVITRFLSGVHWFTDIVGGMIISIGLLLLYSGLITSKSRID